MSDLNNPDVPKPNICQRKLNTRWNSSVQRSIVAQKVERRIRLQSYSRAKQSKEKRKKKWMETRLKRLYDADSPDRMDITSRTGRCSIKIEGASSIDWGYTAGSTSSRNMNVISTQRVNWSMPFNRDIESAECAMSCHYTPGNPYKYQVCIQSSTSHLVVVVRCALYPPHSHQYSLEWKCR